jgi:hypothetical protein
MLIAMQILLTIAAFGVGVFAGVLAESRFGE